MGTIEEEAKFRRKRWDNDSVRFGNHFLGYCREKRRQGLLSLEEFARVYDAGVEAEEGAYRNRTYKSYWRWLGTEAANQAMLDTLLEQHPGVRPADRVLDSRGLIPPKVAIRCCTSEWPKDRLHQCPGGFLPLLASW